MKRFLLALGLLFVLAVVAGIAIIFHRIASFKSPPIPEQLKAARIISGAGLLTKAQFYSQPDLGLITHIEQNANGEFVVAGQTGVSFLNESGSFEKGIQFDRCTSAVVPVEVGAGAFLCRGGWNIGTELLGADGRTLWSYGAPSGGLAVDDAAAGVLGRDESKRVVVGMNGDGGVRLLNAEGKELWKQNDGNVWHVEIAPSDNGQGNVILHSNAKGQLTVRDENGAVLARYTPEVYLADFFLGTWIDDPVKKKIVAADEGAVFVLSMQGKTVAHLPTPENSGIAEPKGIRVEFSKGKPFFAALLRHYIWSRSLLYTYDSQGKITYDEVLDRDCDALYAVADGRAQSLLLGCDGTIWKYSLVR